MTKRKRGTSNAKPGYKKSKANGSTRTAGYYGRYGHGSDELKFLDVTVDDAVVAAGGAINGANFGAVVEELFKVPQGDGESSRDGRQIWAEKIGLHFDVELPNHFGTTGALFTHDIVRIMLIHDKQANGAFPSAITDILETGEYDSFNNLANSKRFRTLFDKTISLNSAAFTTDGAATPNYNVGRMGKSFQKYVKLQMPVEYDGTTGAISTVKSNNIFLIYISKHGIAKVNCQARLRFRG